MYMYNMYMHMYMLYVGTIPPLGMSVFAVVSRLDSCFCLPRACTVSYTVSLKHCSLLRFTFRRVSQTHFPSVRSVV